MLSLIKKPSAFVPMTMSFAALAILLTHIALHGTARQPDEGTGAHLFQILIAAQVPLAGYFALRWFSQFPRQVALLLAAQVAAALIPLSVLYWSGL